MFLYMCANSANDLWKLSNFGSFGPSNFRDAAQIRLAVLYMYRVAQKLAPFLYALTLPT